MYKPHATHNTSLKQLRAEGHDADTAAELYLLNKLDLSYKEIKLERPLYIGAKELFSPSRLQLESLDFLRALLPCAKFVMSYRRNLKA